MLHLDLKSKPNVEKQLVGLVNKRFDASYEKFIENALQKKENALTKLSTIAEDLGIEDLVHNHDEYLYGIKRKAKFGEIYYWNNGFSLN